jgi:CRISPR-associated protein Cmr6
VPDKLLNQAREWLDGALTVLGCGAKTAAGYGSFRADNLPSTSTRKVFETELDLITPAFLAGANQFEPSAPEDCDLRPATLRGLLRWWWRTLHVGYVDVPGLGKLEATIWGDTAVGGGIRIEVIPTHAQKGQKFDFKDRFDPKENFKCEHDLASRPNKKTTQGLFYAAYGMDDTRGEKQRHFLDTGSTWRLRVTAQQTRFFANRDDAGKPDQRSQGILIPAADVLRQAEAAIWLLANYGAVGSKSRKGFGSLQMVSNQIAQLSLPKCKEIADQLRCHLGLPTTFEVDRAQSSNLEQALTTEIQLPWNDPWKAMDEIGFAYQSYAQAKAHEWDKVALGLPRKIHGPRDDKAMPNQTEWRLPQWLDFPNDFPYRDSKTLPKDVRHSSPIHIHVARNPDGKLVVRVVAFLSRHLPDLEKSRTTLQDFLDHFSNALRNRVTASPSSPVRTGPTHASRTEVRSSAPVSRVVVKVLERRERGGKVEFFVQEHGKPRGLLAYGTPPASLPEIDDCIEVYRNNTDVRNPQYRWDQPPPPPQSHKPSRRPRR